MIPLEDIIALLREQGFEDYADDLAAMGVYAEALGAGLERIAKYPETREEELSPAGLRDLARKLLTDAKSALPTTPTHDGPVGGWMERAGQMETERDNWRDIAQERERRIEYLEGRLALVESERNALVKNPEPALARQGEAPATPVVGLPCAAGEGPGKVTVTTNEAGDCVAVTRTDDEGRILSVLWEREERHEISTQSEPTGSLDAFHAWLKGFDLDAYEQLMGPSITPGRVHEYQSAFFAGWQALWMAHGSRHQRGRASPDPLGEALNSGDGSYKP
jgi:hypothetical protein